jgi:hypothetical protein
MLLRMPSILFAMKNSFANKKFLIPKKRCAKENKTYHRLIASDNIKINIIHMAEKNENKFKVETILAYNFQPYLSSNVNFQGPETEPCHNSFLLPHPSLHVSFFTSQGVSI